MSKDAGRKRMLILCPFPIGVAAAQRLKFEQYYDDWRADGWEVDVAPYMDMELWRVLFQPGHWPAKILGALKGTFRRTRDMFRVAKYDLVYCHMYVTPLGTNIFEHLARRLAKRLIVDVEDNVLSGQKRDGQYNPNRVVRWLKGKGKTRLLIRTAEHVITSSPALNDLCMTINEAKACTYITSSVDTDRFVPANRYSNSDRVTIGWTGTFSSKPLLDGLRPVFRTLASRRSFKLRLIGNFDYDLPGVDLEIIQWTAAHEVEDLQAIDIGVYPLPLDDWVSGKSGLKAIQYMAFGLPTVATNAGHTPNIIRHGENGFLVESDDEWVEALELLIDNPALRQRLGEQARLDAVERYSTKAVAKEYRRVLAQVMGGR